jgi:hypothetical protein
MAAFARRISIDSGRVRLIASAASAYFLFLFLLAGAQKLAEEALCGHAD